MPVEFDTLSSADLTSGGSEIIYLPDEFGLYGQTFTATSANLALLEFAIDHAYGSGSVELTVMIATIRFDGGGFHPDELVFQSALITVNPDADDNDSIVSVDTTGLTLVPGQRYVILFNANSGDGPSYDGALSFVSNPQNDSEYFVYNHTYNQNDDAAFDEANWYQNPANGSGWGDIAIRLSYGPSNVAPSAPVDTDGASGATVAEDLAIGSVIGLTASSTDADVGDTVSYSFGFDGLGDPILVSARFAIDPVTGVVTVNTALDYEAATFYNLTIYASDGTDYSSSIFTVNITNVLPTAPVDDDAASNSVAENSALGTATGVTAASTENNGGPVAYALTDNAGGRFVIDSVTGAISTGLTNIDYEAAPIDGFGRYYNVTAIAQEGTGDSIATVFRINITNVNETPDAVDDVLGTVSSVELITNGGFESGTTGWTLTDGGSGGWSVESDTLPPNGAYATPGPQAGTYYIVSYQGGPGVHALEQSFTVPDGTVSVTVDFALFVQTYTGDFVNSAGLDYTAYPNQHARVDLLVGGATALSTNIADIIQNFYLGIDGAPTQPWTVYTFDLTGDVNVGGTYDLRFAQVDNQGNFNLGVDAVTVTAEVLSALTDEDTAIVIQGADLLANDTDPDGDTLTISAVSALSALGGAVTLNIDGTIGYDPTVGLNYLAEGEVVEDSFTYTVDDGNGGTDTATVTFRVVGINDAPTAPVDTDGPSGATISEHLAVGSVIGLDAFSTDPEGDTVSYSFGFDLLSNPILVDGHFTIDPVTGVVTLTSAVNFELDTSHSLTIYASDGSASASTEFTVNVTNVVEHLFTPFNDGTQANPINFNLLPDGAYDFDGAQYDALAGNDWVILPNLATVDAGNPWNYNMTFSASAGNDVIQGGDGNDIISGGEGNDWLFGADGDDRLVGSSGNDILAGGDGSDKLTGASGKDIFIFTASEFGTTKLGEHDTITDFKQGEDKIDISALFAVGTFAGIKAGQLTGNAGSIYKVGYYTESGKTWVTGDTNGNGYADFAIELSGSYKLKGTDLLVSNSVIGTQADWTAATAPAVLNYAQFHSDYYIV